MKTTILFLMTASLFAAEAPKGTPDPNSPVPVSAEKTAKYWRSIAEAQAADAQAKAKHDAITSTVNDMKAECSAMNPVRVLGQGQDGDPVCVVVSQTKPANNK